jgi:hypothetical protein
MRLWVLCLLALLFVGLLIAVEQSGVFDRVMGRNVRVNDPMFGDYQRGSTSFLDEDGKDVFVAQVYPDTPLILSGFPSYTSKQFRLPTDARPLSGTYNLVFSSDTVPGSEGALRVTINGVKRADTVLQPGRVRQRVQVELTPTELAAGELDVRLALIGHGPMAECTPNEALAAVVTILPESGLRMALDKAPSTIADRLALWGDLIPVKWRADGKAVDAVTLITAARLAQRGYGIYFGDKGYAGQQLADVEKVAAGRPSRIPQLRYPISLVSVSENAGARRFDRETTWRYRYDVSQLPNGELPSALDLRMLVGPIGDTRTALFVTLNDHLLLTRTLSDTDQRFNNSVALPAGDQSDRNELAVTLTAHERDEQRCGSRRLIAAEMLPDTVLRGGGERLIPPLAQVAAQVRANMPAAFKSGTLSAPQAQNAALLLAQMKPTSISFSSSQPGSTIEVLTGDVSAALRRVNPVGQQWLVYFPGDQRAGAMVEPFSPQGGAAKAAVALLVTVNRPAEAAAPAPAAGAAGTPRATADAAQ